MTEWVNGYMPMIWIHFDGEFGLTTDEVSTTFELSGRQGACRTGLVGHFPYGIVVDDLNQNYLCIGRQVHFNYPYMQTKANLGTPLAVGLQ